MTFPEVYLFDKNYRKYKTWKLSTYQKRRTIALQMSARHGKRKTQVPQTSWQNHIDEERVGVNLVDSFWWLTFLPLK